MVRGYAHYAIVEYPPSISSPLLVEFESPAVQQGAPHRGWRCVWRFHMRGTCLPFVLLLAQRQARFAVASSYGSFVWSEIPVAASRDCVYVRMHVWLRLYARTPKGCHLNGC